MDRAIISTPTTDEAIARTPYSLLSQRKYICLVLPGRSEIPMNKSAHVIMTYNPRKIPEIRPIQI
jgi:hypothetical protein